VRLLLAVVLLAGNAFFVGAQFALITARRDQVEPLAHNGSRSARLALAQMRGLPRMLAGSQLGIAICSLGLGAVAEPTIAHLLEDLFDVLRLPDGLLHPVAFVLALVFVSYLHMVLGEMVPKNLALAGPVRAATLLAPPMAGWVWLTRPILVTINGLANAVLRLFRIEPKDELSAAYTAEEFGDLFSESAAEGLLDDEERQRLTQALALDQTTARDLVIDLADLVTAGETTTAADLEGLVARTGFSRFPIRAGAALVGYVHVKDLLDIDPGAYDQPIPARLRRPMIAIEPALPLTDVFAALQRARSHMATVVAGDRTLGAIALEDVLEVLVGEVQDASHPGGVHTPQS
jgi:CBS domain containing-hemolysin-like protein